MTVPDREADENIVFTGEMPSISLNPLLIYTLYGLLKTR